MDSTPILPIKGNVEVAFTDDAYISKMYAPSCRVSEVYVYDKWVEMRDVKFDLPVENKKSILVVKRCDIAFINRVPSEDTSQESSENNSQPDGAESVLADFVNTLKGAKSREQFAEVIAEAEGRDVESVKESVHRLTPRILRLIHELEHKYGVGNVSVNNYFDGNEDRKKYIKNIDLLEGDSDD